MAINLTNAIAFENIKTIEERDKITDTKQIYGYGIRGNKFKLVTKSSSFISKIWFSFLKTIRLIKVNNQSMENVKLATLKHIDTSDYKNWAIDNVKITKQGFAALINRNKELESQSVVNNAKLEGLSETTKTHEETVKTQKARIKTLEKEVQVSKNKISDCESKKTTLENELKDDTLSTPIEETPLPVLEKKLKRLTKENKAYKAYFVANHPNENLEALLQKKPKKEIRKTADKPKEKVPEAAAAKL